MMANNNQIAQFAARELGCSLSEISINSKIWALVGIRDDDGLVRTYELSKGDSAPCVKIHLSMSRSFIVEKIFYPKSIDRVVNGEIVLSDKGNPEKVKVMTERAELKNPRMLIKVLREIFSARWALQAVRHGDVTPHYLACACITEQLGLEMMSDRQMLQGFANATDDQLILAEKKYQELEATLTLKQSETSITVRAIESNETIEVKAEPKKTKKSSKFIEGETVIYTAEDAHEILQDAKELTTA